MPEIVTKYPDVALKILKEAGAQCGAGAKQQILTTCPPSQFCRLPTGEICVYGISDISKMTQITAVDLAPVVGQVPTISSWLNIVLLTMVFVIGMLVGKWLKHNSNK